MAVNWAPPTEARGPLVAEKLAAFERIHDEFVACFSYVEEVHGQHRFADLPVRDIVRYLHARWVCECKDRLLSVPQTTRRYEGERCLALLRDWQASETAEVVSFLQRKLGMLDFGQLTRQRQDALRQENGPLTRRLTHGRAVLLNRAVNLHRALDAIFTLDDASLIVAVREACEALGHLPDEIAGQLSLLNTPAYAYVPHPQLAQQNMVVMNALGVRVTDDPANAPGQRTDAVARPDMPLPPYAQQVIAGELDLSGMQHNNPKRLHEANALLNVDAPDAISPAPPVPPAPGAAEGVGG